MILPAATSGLHEAMNSSAPCKREREKWVWCEQDGSLHTRELSTVLVAYLRRDTVKVVQVDVVQPCVCPHYHGKLSGPTVDQAAQAHR